MGLKDMDLLHELPFHKELNIRFQKHLGGV